MTPTRRRVLVRAGFVLGALVVSAALVIAAEHYAAYKLRTIGWNSHGYRGQALGRKSTREVRVFAIGGSTTYGFTVSTQEAYPAQLERKLNARLSSQGLRVTVANLGHLSDSSVCYYPTYRDYEYLGPDIVIVYEGYNDIIGNIRRTAEFDCYRQSSAIFRWTGFFPILPVALKEKWFAIRYGSVDRGYRETQRIEEARRAASAQARSGGDVVAPAGPTLSPYETYERNVLAFVELLLRRGKSVVFASQPYLGDPHHLEQQTRIRQALAPYFTNPHFRYRDFLYLFGGKWDARWFNAAMWLNASGNELLAERFVEPVAALALSARGADVTVGRVPARRD